MTELTHKEHEYADRFEGCTWQPEFGSWMVESTPNRPYTGYANDLTRLVGQQHSLHITSPSCPAS